VSRYCKSLSAVQWIVDCGCPRRRLARFVLENGISEQECLSIIEWMHENDIYVFVDKIQTACAAARKGYVTVLDALNIQKYEVWNYVTREAAKHGNVMVVQWVLSKNPLYPSQDDWTCREAAEHGQLGTLQWLRAQNPPFPWDATVCCVAAQYGHLNILQWLRAQDPPCPWSEMVCSAAAKAAHLPLE
jgi:hypothetical protein